MSNMVRPTRAMSSKGYAEQVRSRIKTSKLIEALQKNALDGGKHVPNNDFGKLMANGQIDERPTILLEMTAGRIKSAEILLRKTLPDLSSIDISAVITAHEASLDELDGPGTPDTPEAA